MYITRKNAHGEEYKPQNDPNAWELGKTIVGVGVNFSSNTKNIEDWVAEEIEYLP